MFTLWDAYSSITINFSPKVPVFRKPIIACLCVPIICIAGGAEKNDVKQFVDNADTCLHLAGEFDSSLSTKEQKEITAPTNKYCLRAKKKLETLLIKYKNDPKVQATISQYDDIKYIALP